MNKISGKILPGLAIFAVLITPLASGCANKDSDTSITFDQLFSNPNQYNGKVITIEGFIFLGFETMVLSEELRNSGYAEGHLIPSERMLWFESGLPTEIYDQLYEQNMMGPNEKYGKLRVEGIFQYGEQYGHLGMYEYQISPSEIQLLPWAPN
jgi:hypothetical protein